MSSITVEAWPGDFWRGEAFLGGAGRGKAGIIIVAVCNGVARVGQVWLGEVWEKKP